MKICRYVLMADRDKWAGCGIFAGGDFREPEGTPRPDGISQMNELNVNPLLNVIVINGLLVETSRELCC